MAAPGSPAVSPAGDRRPLLVAGVTAALSVGLLALAVRGSLLGADVGRGAGFCEAARAGWVKQPANTWSNAGFVVAGLSVAWHARRPDRLGAGLGRHPGLATAYAALVVLLGPASAAMHATQSALGGHLDMLSMYLVASFAASYALMRLRRAGHGFFGVVFAACLLGCEVIGLWGREIPVVMHAGNIAFGVLLLTAVALEVVMLRRGVVHADLRPGLLAVGSLAVAFAIWNLTKTELCDPDSLIQGHAVWHLLGAVSAYFLYRYYASEHGPEGTPCAPGEVEARVRR